MKFRPGVPDSVKAAKHGRLQSEVIRDHKSLRLHHIRLKKGMPVEQALAHYQRDPDVEYAEPNYLVSIQNTPNDTKYGQLWGMTNISAPTAWDITTGNGNTVVAILDTGIDYAHRDLVANLWVNQGEVNGIPGADNDGNGYRNDIYGYNAVADSGDPKDDHYHGTHVAGTIAAVGNNGLDVIGVAWNAKVMACKFIDDSGWGTNGDAIECLQYVKTMKARGANIVATNNSWGSPSYSQALYDAIREQKDILFVAAAGNDNTKAAFYPADYNLPNIVSVAASDSSDSKASFSNYGKWAVDIAAPGLNILSTYPGSYLATLSGTSMAAPHVSGLAALLYSQNPARTAATVKNLILSGGDAASSFADITVTGKRINAYKSLTCSNAPFFEVLHLPADPRFGVAETLSAMSINCGVPVGPVSAQLSSGAVIQLHDDGVVPDEVAGDGIFSATWIPGSGTERITFSSSTATIAVSSPPVAIGDTPSILSTAVLIPGSTTSATTGVPFSQTFPTSGGIAPFSWSLIRGSLPSGLTLNSATGEISGTPAVSGVFAITIQVSDAVGVKDRKEWKLVVNQGLRPGWPRELKERVGTGPLPNSSSPVFADLDGDGKDEIIVTDGGAIGWGGDDTSTLYILYSDGSRRSISLEGTLSSPVAADLDGDGLKEVIISRGYYYTNLNSIYAFHSDLTPVSGFPAGGYPSANGGPGHVTAPVVADFNNDGRPEIAVISSATNTNDPNYGTRFAVMVDGSGRMMPGWPKPAGIFPAWGQDETSPAAGDLDRDGRQELVIASNDGYVRVYRADGTIFNQWQFDTDVVKQIMNPVIADMDGDGYPEIIFKYESASNYNITKVYSRSGTLLPGWPRVLPGGIESPVGPVVADIDGNGLPEVIAIAGDSVNELHVLKGDGSYLPGWPVTFPGYSGDAASFDCHPVVADVDGDGGQDVVVTADDYMKNGKVLAFNSAGVSLPGFPKYASPVSEVRSTAAIGDFDGNGKLDIVVKSENGFLWNWEMPQQGGNVQWPMFRKDDRHSAMWMASGPVIAPAAYDFQTVPTGTSSAPHSFTILNPLYQDLNLSSLAISGGSSAMFTISAGTCGTLPVVLRPMQSCSVGVIFSPTEGGARTSTLVASSTTAGVTSGEASLSGTGLLPPTTFTYTKSGAGGGSVSSSTGTIYTQSGSEVIGKGTQVTLTATPAPDSLFDGWAGCDYVSGNICTVTMSADRSVTGTFSLNPLLNPATLISMSAGENHTLVAQNDGTVWAWGFNSSGQLGDGTKTTRIAPVRVTALTGAIALAAGSHHSVALKGDGTVWAWGYNGYGQLGDGTTTDRIAPVQVPGLSGITAIATGIGCTFALKQDGTVWGWGNNAAGQLGDGTKISRYAPVRAGTLSGVTAIAAANFFTVARKSDGTVWTWGSSPTGVSSVPAQVPSLSDVTAIAPQFDSIQVLKLDGTVWGWGDNSYGQLGDGSTTRRSAPVQVRGVTGVTAIAGGYHHALALRSDGTVWAWGKNTSGQLGDGSSSDRYLPVQVAEMAGATAIAAGGDNSFNLTADNRAWGWGANSSGRVGDGTQSYRYTPSLISGIGSIVLPSATLSGWDSQPTNWTSAYYTVGGSGVVAYKYKLDGSAYSAEIPVSTRLTVGPLSEGTHIVAVIGVDSVGKWQQLPTVTSVNIDLTPPVATVTGAPAGPTTATNATLTIGGTDVTGYQWKLDDGSYSQDTYYPMTLTLTGLGDGTHTVSVVGRDRPGNYQVTPTVANWTVDTTAPATTPLPGSGYLAAGQKVALSCSDGAGSGCATTRYCLGSGCTPATLYSGPVPITSSTDLRFYSADALGNTETVRTASYTLLAADYAVNVAVSGKGAVTSTPAGISTSGSTSARFAGGSTVTLRATPGAFSLFAGWSGACSGSGDCVLSMTGDRSVTATFTADSAWSTYIPGAGIYSPTIQAAYDASSNSNMIQLWGTDFTEQLLFSSDKKVAISGGYDRTYGSQAGATILHGSIRILRGAVTIDKVAFR